MAHLTFPIDTKEPHEIPAFSEILDKYPGSGAMIKYLCYRFDPKCELVRSGINVAERHRIAEGLSGTTCPIPDTAFVDEDGVAHFSDEWNMFSSVTSMFFPLLNNPEWEFLVSLEITINESNSLLREPIPEKIDVDTKTKIILLKQKATEGLREALNMRQVLIDRLVDGDERAQKSVTSPHSRAKRGLDGRIKC